MNKLMKLVCYINILAITFISSSAFGAERTTIFLKTNACKAYIAGNAELCGGDSDCFGAVSKRERFCQTKDCLAISREDPSQCISPDCKAVMTGIPSKCSSATETNCKVILAKKSDKCSDFSGKRKAERIDREKKDKEGHERVITKYASSEPLNQVSDAVRDAHDQRSKRKRGQ